MLTSLIAMVSTGLFSGITVDTSCPKTFTPKMIKRAIDATFAGTRDVTDRDRSNLRRYFRCARNTQSVRGLIRYRNRAYDLWYKRRHPPMYTQLASWYEDAGGTACGFHAYYGVANKVLPCGTQVIFRYHGRQVTAVVQDRGPFVGGRVWDLNQNLAGALGFGGVDYVQASVAG